MAKKEKKVVSPEKRLKNISILHIVTLVVALIGIVVQTYVMTKTKFLPVALIMLYLWQILFVL